MLSMFDQWLFLSINSATASSPILTVGAIFFAKFALVILLGMLIVMSARSFIKLRTTLIGCVLSYALAQLIGTFWFRSRPFVDLVAAQKLIEKSSLDKSFPSDHATLAFAAATLLFSLNPRFGYAAYACAALIALSRVMTGVHYPSDVIGGALLGIGVVWCVKHFFSRAAGV